MQEVTVRMKTKLHPPSKISRVSREGLPPARKNLRIIRADGGIVLEKI